MRRPAPARRMPAEWEPHAATWLAWPHNVETWPGCLDAAETAFVQMIRALAGREAVHVLVQDASHAGHVREQIGEVPVTLHCVATDDAWMRDIGPTFVHDSAQGLTAIDWTFNAWGGKYPPWEQDDAVARRIAEILGVARLRPGVVLEGGALEVDGAGTLLVTRSSVLDPRRNPATSLEAIEARLADLLGVRKVIWLEAKIAGDDTDGHVDTVARFVGPGRVVCAREPDARDPNHAPLEACATALRTARDARDRPLDVIDLPMPPPLEAEGERLPASYANFYIANGRVLVPIFGVTADEAALQRLAALFPERSVVGIPSQTLVRGLGTVHCLTLQQPAPR